MSSTGDGSSKRSSAGSRIPSCTSTCTLDSIGCDTAPPLPLVVRVRECMLCQRPQNSATGPGWGFVLRGTTSELAEGLKLYTCHIDTVHQNGAAKVSMRWILCLSGCKFTSVILCFSLFYLHNFKVWLDVIFIGLCSQHTLEKGSVQCEQVNCDRALCTFCVSVFDIRILTICRS